MTEKRFRIKQKIFKNKFEFENDYRATAESLKKILSFFDDDLTIGVLYDSGMTYYDLHEISLMMV